VCGCVNPGIAPPSLSAYYTLFPFTATNGSEDSSGGGLVFVYTVMYIEREGRREVNIHEIELLVCKVD
jgi:hypothetical protein